MIGWCDLHLPTHLGNTLGQLVAIKNDVIEYAPSSLTGESIMREMVRAFLDYLTSERGLSGNTVAAYGSDLNQLVDLMEERGFKAGWDSMDISLLTNYALELQERGYSATTRARKIASLKSMFNFLVEEGVVEEDPTESLSSPRIGRALPKSLSEEEMALLLREAYAGETVEARRDVAMIELMYASGMRVSELVSLAVGDLNVREKYVRCLGKGFKERLINLHDQAVDTVDAYLAEVRPEILAPRGKDGEKEDALFLNHRGERLTRQGFWLILKGYGRRAGIRTPITPHTLRHSFATHMLRGGAPLRYLQELLGHASISTTQVYTHLAEDQVERDYNLAHPRA